MAAKSSRWLAILAFITSLSAPAKLASQIVQTPLGTAEVIGLRNWTLQRLLDTLRIRRPGVSIDKCAAELRAIGFPDVLVQRYFDNGKFYSLVAVVEPEMAEFVRYRTLPYDSLPPVPGWEQGYQFLQEGSKGLAIAQAAIAIRGLQIASRDSIINMFSLQNRVNEIDALLQFLEIHRKAEDLETAAWILLHDGNWRSRILAALLLSNFPEHDLSWWSLIDALRDPDGRVSSFAQLSLRYFLRLERKHQVNLRPVYYSLYYLLNGTNLFAFQTVLELLIQMPLPERDLHWIFRKSGAYMVLAFLGARRPEPRKTAHEFLVANFRRDLGESPDAWKHFLGSGISQ